jgi:hypothetical protein
MESVKIDYYDRLKKYDYGLYRKAIEFAFGLTTNIEIKSGKKFDLDVKAYIERDIIAFLVDCLLYDSLTSTNENW